MELSSLIEEKQNNPRWLFSTVGKLTKSQSPLDPPIPFTTAIEGFINLFTNSYLNY